MDSLFSKTRQFLLRWSGRVRGVNDMLLEVGLAVLVGLGSGAGVWLLKQLIELFRGVFFTDLGGLMAPLGGWTVAVFPVLGGAVVGLLVHRWLRREKHHGVAGIMELVALGGGRLKYQLIPVKTLAASLSIGCGASVGPEDPSVQIGANFASWMGQRFGFAEERMRPLVAAGAAGAVAAAFNAPIAAVFFALEVILGEISGSGLSLVVLSSVISAIFTQAVSGPQPAFKVPAYTFNSPWEVPIYMGLGILAGFVAVAYIRLLYFSKDRFDRSRLPVWARPAAAGLAVGLVGIWLPQVFGVGYDTIEAILNGQNLSWLLLAGLLLAKLILTPVSIGGGFQGGVFAPSLFLGAALGGGYGIVVNQLFPGLELHPAAFAMVGMGAVLAGAIHAPLTAALLLFEMTNDYHIILPLLLAVIISLLIARRLNADSVYTLSLARKGIRLERGKDIEVLEGIAVSEVMETDTPTLSEETPLEEVDRLLFHTRRHGLPVMDGSGELAGMLTLADLEAARDQPGKSTAGQACTRQLISAYPDETLGTALRRMGIFDVGRLPVVDRQNPRRMVGMLRRADVVRAYDAALTRRASLRHRMEESRLGTFTGLQVEDITIHLSSPCDGHRMQDIHWPVNCLVASIRRGSQLLIPHGDTRLQVGDVLVVVMEEAARAQIRQLTGAAEDGGALE